LEIARELHDIVAHSMSLIAVQAGVANYVVSEHPEEAARALGSIEQTSRATLLEMRALLEVLRAPRHRAIPPPQDPDLVPAPGLANLDSLAERSADAGLHVDLDVHGRRTELSPGPDLAAYRVIQEAITNVIKHAATDHCRVIVTYEKDALTLEITDNWAGARRNIGKELTAGYGIAGMRERVTMYGGQLHAGPLPERGFRVTARFPLTGPAS
jgi:signal transduction histidine kinase